MRFILLAAAAFGVSVPAFADPCVIRRTDAGLASVVSADISQDGKSAQKVLLLTGPIQAPFQLDGAATGYTIKPGEQAALYLYRFGASLPDKDWRDAGSIGSQDGGFGIDWPRLMHDGKPVALRVVVKVGGFGRDDKPVFAASAERDGVQLLLSDDFVPPRDLVVVGRGTEPQATANTRANWSQVLQAHKPMTLLLYDATANIRIASASFAWPTAEATQSRYVADIGALRKAFAERSCATE